MKEFIRKIWDAIVRLICKVPYDKWLHFIFGMIIATFAAIVFQNKFCIVFAVAFALLKELFDKWNSLSALLSSQ